MAIPSVHMGIPARPTLWARLRLAWSVMDAVGTSLRQFMGPIAG